MSHQQLYRWYSTIRLRPTLLMAAQKALCIRRTLCRHVTIGTPMAIFAVWTVFWLFWRLVHCWYSRGRPVTIGTPMVLTVFDDWCSVPIVKNMSTQSPPNTQSPRPRPHRPSASASAPAEYTKPCRIAKHAETTSGMNTEWIINVRYRTV